MRDQCGAIFRQARKELETCGLLNEAKPNGETSGSGNEESLASDIDKELESLQGKVGPDVVTKLEELLVKSQALKHGLARAKRVKVVRSELNKAKKNLATTDSSQSDAENEVGDSKNSSQSSGEYSLSFNRTKMQVVTKLLYCNCDKYSHWYMPIDLPSLQSWLKQVSGSGHPPYFPHCFSFPIRRIKSRQFLFDSALLTCDCADCDQKQKKKFQNFHLEKYTQKDMYWSNVKLALKISYRSLYKWLEQSYLA
jgi:hypothetical protein